MRFKILLIVFCLSFFKGYSQKYSADSVILYLNKYKTICENDHGELWGLDFYVNIAVFDKDTRKIVTNFPDTYGLLKKDKGFYTGILPDSIKPEDLGKFYSIFDWLGQGNKLYYIGNIFHEIFHSFQDSLKLNPPGYLNKHIDSLYARITLRMEWYYLWQALVCDTGKVKENVKGAIFWRNYRRSIYPLYRNDENWFEISEGFPQYTQFILGAKENNENPLDLLILYYQTELEKNDVNTTFTRKFGYYSGAFYGFLLDRYMKDWRRQVTRDSDLGKMLANSLNISYSVNIDSLKYYKSSSVYKEKYKEEKSRENEMHKKVLSIKRKFNKHPLLVAEKSNHFYFTFNINTMQMIDNDNFYLPYFNVTDDWGIITIKKNGGMISDKLLKFPANHIIIKDGEAMSEDNWSLKLNFGWQIIKNKRDYYIIKNVK